MAAPGGGHRKSLVRPCACRLPWFGHQLLNHFKDLFPASHARTVFAPEIVPKSLGLRQQPPWTRVARPTRGRTSPRSAGCTAPPRPRALPPRQRQPARAERGGRAAHRRPRLPRPGRAAAQQWGSARQRNRQSQAPSHFTALHARWGSGCDPAGSGAVIRGSTRSHAGPSGQTSAPEQVVGRVPPAVSGSKFTFGPPGHAAVFSV